MTAYNVEIYAHANKLCSTGKPPSLDIFKLSKSFHIPDTLVLLCGKEQEQQLDQQQVQSAEDWIEQRQQFSPSQISPDR